MYDKYDYWPIFATNVNTAQGRHLASSHLMLSPIVWIRKAKDFLQLKPHPSSADATDVFNGKFPSRWHFPFWQTPVQNKHRKPLCNTLKIHHLPSSVVGLS
jgi:hypothetical protein